MMRHPAISDVAKVYLLLTSRMATGRRSRNGADAGIALLTLSTLNPLVARLNDIGAELEELVSHRGDDLIDALEPNFDVGNLRGLLGRGLQMSLAIERWQQRGIWVLSREDEKYPRLLRSRMGDKAPPIIYGCGESYLFNENGLAIVGSRNASRSALDFAKNVGRQAADNSFSVVSGAARGVDRASITGALDAGGNAVGVLADGLSRAAISQANRIPISEDRLVLITPYDPDAGFSTGNAMGRNKLIFALSNAGLVAETDYEKGGTWAGATEQLKRLKFVPMFVRSTGTPSQGLDELKKLGALEWPDPYDSDAVHNVFEEILSGALEKNEPSTAQSSSIASPRQAALVMDPGEPFGADTSEAIIDQTISHPSDALFADVHPHILAVLKTPKSRDEIADELDLVKTQVDRWLARLVDEGAVTKHERPVRYVANE